MANVLNTDKQVAIIAALTDDPEHPKRHVTVLHIPPAVSPQTAVRAAIMQEIQSHARTQA